MRPDNVTWKSNCRAQKLSPSLAYNYPLPVTDHTLTYLVMHPGQFHAFHCQFVNVWHLCINNLFLSSWSVFPLVFHWTEMAFNHPTLVYVCCPDSLLQLSYKIIQSFLLYMQINSTVQPVYTTHRGRLSQGANHVLYVARTTSVPSRYNDCLL